MSNVELTNCNSIADKTSKILNIPSDKTSMTSWWKCFFNARLMKVTNSTGKCLLRDLLMVADEEFKDVLSRCSPVLKLEGSQMFPKRRL